MGFQVALESCGFGAGRECDDGENAPWAVFSRVTRLASVVLREAPAEVVGKAGVMALRVRFAHEDVDVVERGHGVIVPELFIGGEDERAAVLREGEIGKGTEGGRGGFRMGGRGRMEVLLRGLHGFALGGWG